MPEEPEDETDPRIEQALRLGELRKEVMVNEALPNETTVLPKGQPINTRIDAAEYGTAEDPDGTDIWLRYYADEETRAHWDGPLPPRESPPYDRDRFLPVPPEERSK